MIGNVLRTVSSFLGSTWVAAIFVVLATTYFLIRRRAAGARCLLRSDLSGKTVIITGANSGIGKETARGLAAMGAKLILACRNQEDGERAAKEINSSVGSDRAACLPLDLASFASIRAFVARVKAERLNCDILINNAATAGIDLGKTEDRDRDIYNESSVDGCGEAREMMTSLFLEDGFERVFAANHLGPFLLTRELLPIILEAQSPRIINVSSSEHRLFPNGFAIDDTLVYGDPTDYIPRYIYAKTKACNILFTNELQRQLKAAGSNCLVVSLHPGIVNTMIFRNFKGLTKLFIGFVLLPLVGKTPTQGAQTSIYAAIAPDIPPAAYLGDCKVAPYRSEFVNDASAAKKLWDLSEKLIGGNYTSITSLVGGK